MLPSGCDILVVGGGFYGCLIAAHLRARGASVALLERGPGLLGRASFANQARVHHGYHYPRSLLTAARSRANYARFRAAFPECIAGAFQKLYAVGREFSKVTGAGFAGFCRRVGIPAEPAPREYRDLFDTRLVDAVFLAEEVAFDAGKLRERMAADLRAAGVGVRLGTEAVRVNPAAGGRVVVHTAGADGPGRVVAGAVFNCSYARMNQLALASGLPVTPLRHELAEMALVRVPAELRDVGVTLMCGPFFSCMPFPPAGLHTLSHVRYTPHAARAETTAADSLADDVLANAPRASAFDRMRRDAARFVPLLARAEYVRSLWEVKTILPANDGDDGRPILFREHAGLPNYHLVLGAKIDTAFDVLDRIDALFSPSHAEAA